MVDLEVVGEEVETKVEQETPNGQVLKELPKHLCYAFFGESITKPDIVSSTLSDEMHDKLVEVLKRNIEDFAWCLMILRGLVLPFTIIRSL